MICATSLVSSGMSTTLNAMREFYGLTNTQTATVQTVKSAAGLAAALISARVFGFLGIKKTMLLSMLCGAATFALFALSRGRMAVLIAGGAFGGICYSYGLMLPASMIIRRWFNKSRGTALGIASCGTGLVSIIFAPAVQKIIDTFGITAAFVFQGGFLLLTAAVLLLLIVETPEKKGLEPLGGFCPDNPARKITGSSELGRGGVAALVTATALIGACAGSAVTFFTSHFVIAGLDKMKVAYALSVYGVVLVSFKFIHGICTDRLGVFRTSMIYGIVCMLGIFAIGSAVFIPTNAFMIFSLSLFASGAAIQTLGYPSWALELDGKKYEKTLSRCQTGYQLGALVGSFIPVYLADRFGSYMPAYYLNTAFTAAAIATVAILYAKKRRKEKAAS